MKSMSDSIFTMHLDEEKLYQSGLEYNHFFSALHDLYSHFSRESDYGVVLLCAANIDQYLYKILKATFRKGSNVSKTLLDPGKGKLGDYQVKADLLYALEILDKYRYEDIKFIGKVRNVFGHSEAVVSLSEGEVYDNLLAKRFASSGEFNGSGRERFLQVYNQTIAILLNVLMHRIEHG